MKIKIIKYAAVLIAFVLLMILAIEFTGKKYFEREGYTWWSNDGIVLVRGNNIDKIRDDIDKLTYAINRSDNDPETFRTPENKEPVDPPKLKLIGIKGNIASVEVINAEHLTQRMGSSGADNFLAQSTFTLTENKNIKFVNFVFEEGDHASPGIYSRNDFLVRWKPIIN